MHIAKKRLQKIRHNLQPLLLTYYSIETYDHTHTLIAHRIGNFPCQSLIACFRQNIRCLSHAING